MRAKDDNHNCGQCRKDMDERFMLIGVYSMIQIMKVSEGLSPKLAISAVERMSNELLNLSPKKKDKLLKSIDDALPERFRNPRPLKRNNPK
ncbi:MAG: hypothetical protein EPN22_16825 [Nitrospirae bacterium]|nr:MAG: hypothetical protein EPN22_16825 [Nitrospirota bacterium]